MTKYCKECGREEIGYGSILDEDGYCPNCAVRHNDKKIKELKQELRLRIEENESMYNELCKKAQQLHEANEVIKKYASGEYKVKAPKYVGTCYGTNLITGEPDKEDLYEGYYFAKVPFANNTKPATAYLKKWGVQ